MCSITDTTQAPVTVPELSRLVAHLHEAARAVTAALASDPTLIAEVPDELLESFALDLHAAHDASGAAATVVTGRVETRIGGVQGKLIAGRYPSTRRWLEVEAGLAPAAATAMVARGRDLWTHSTPIADAWLAGEIPGGAVRELTLGVTDVIKRSSRTDTPVARAEAWERLLPIARTRNVRRVQREVAELKLRLDPDGCSEEALHAFENQSLSIVDVGGMLRISGWLTPEDGAAAKTVLEQRARVIAEQEAGPVSHDATCDHMLDRASDCSCGEADRARRASGQPWDRLLARAFSETMRDQLDNATIGSHHRVAPHITVITDLTDAAGPMIGQLTVPGSDHDVLIPEVTVRRLLCDAEITRVVTSLTHPTASCGLDSDGFRPALVDALREAAREVLYVGRAERVVTARLRRALEVRDRHCVFPRCHAHVRRCQAHHVVPWEDGGETDLPNMATLCVAHHHAVHEGGWSMSLKAGPTGHEQGCWEFEAPPLRRRRLRP